MRKLVIYGFAAALLAVCGSCGKFLLERNLSAVANIKSLHDMQALMDAANTINTGVYSSLLEMASDNFFLGKSGFDRASDLEKATFTWADEYGFEIRDVTAHWSRTFHIIAIANTVLDELPLAHETKGLSGQHIEGTASFLRAFAYFNLVQIYCEAYDPLNATMQLGLPLRLEADVNIPSVRSSLEETYRVIALDLRKAIDLLPVTSQYKTRPDKASAHALLAKVYLLMERYADALEQVERSLSFYDSLLDYNSLDASSLIPITNLNRETLFYATSSAGILNPSRECYVDTALFASYLDSDLRKRIFFKNENNGYASFRGSYTGQIGAGIFLGLTVSENLLIKAECLARLGRSKESLDALNGLLAARYDQHDFVPLHMGNPDSLLVTVLQERRKELLFRGSRWSDLKRLNRDTRFAETLVRKIPGDDTFYELPPGDPRYVFLIPHEVIKMTGMPQNPR